MESLGVRKVHPATSQLSKISDMADFSDSGSLISRTLGGQGFFYYETVILFNWCIIEIYVCSFTISSNEYKIGPNHNLLASK